MFAGATREVVFSDSEVIRRVNEEFIPVALKAALVNNPPPGVEGELYAEIARSKPAPQGICTTNSAGKVLSWALSFDDDDSILQFLDYVSQRHRQSADEPHSVTAERFRRFPSIKLADVADSGMEVTFPHAHTAGDRCPARPTLEEGTLVGRIVGRALDTVGKPVTDTKRQENYMEARIEVPVFQQRLLAAAAARADGKRFKIPDAFARSLLANAYLGQLDVDPSRNGPGCKNLRNQWQFWGQTIDTVGSVRIRIEGESSVEGEQYGRDPSNDGRLWQHRVRLNWYGFADIKGQRVLQLAMLANGEERLGWGNLRFGSTDHDVTRNLMAGRAIDLDCNVRYGLIAQTCEPEEVAERGPLASQRAIQAKMRHFQEGMRQLSRSGGDSTEIARLMEEFGPLVKQQQFNEAEALLDRALKLLE